MAEQLAKTCIWCKQDCSSKPRQKDLKGNYLCKECVEPYQRALTARAKQRRPERTPTTPVPSDSAAGTGNVLVSMIDQTIDMDGEACPSCSRVLALDAVICTHCGYNKNTGRQMRSHVTTEKAPKSEATSAGASISLSSMDPSWITAGLLAVSGGLFAYSWTNPAFLLALYAWGAVMGLIGIIYLIASAFSDGHTGWGIVALASFIPIAGLVFILASLYYVFFVSDRSMLRAFYLTSIVSITLAILGFFQIACAEIESSLIQSTTP